MKSRIIAFGTTLATALILGLTVPMQAEAHNKRLSDSYTYTVGDDIAERVGGLFRVVAGLEASTLVFYDRKERNIVAYVVGNASEVEGAKRELEAFVSAVREYVVTYAKSQHSFDLTDKDVTLVYFNDGGESTPFEIVRRENGDYKVPPEQPADERE